MIGQKLGSFLIEEKIGAGAMGVVFRAVHEPTGRTVAIKVMTNEAEQKPNVAKRFRREADILQSFKHDHIVRFHGVGRYQGTNYFAMEYVTGGTLEDVLERKGVLSWRETVRYAIEILDALHYAHERHVFHRDLKPSNLLLTEKGQIKLTDFGIAKDEGAEALTATGRTLGTAAYMAPEQIKGDPPISHKTDLYAMGCLMYQMLTGHTPFKGTSAVVLMHQHLSERAPRVSAKNPDVPKELDELVLTLMAKDVTKRPWDAQQVRHDLEELAARADRGESIAMAFAGGSSPARLGGPVAAAVPDTVDDHAPPPSTSLGGDAPAATKGTRARKARSPGVSTDPAVRVERLKTIGLATTLVALVALLAYLLWPPGAAKLYAQAEGLMASAEYTDWTKADREFLSELDRRFPDLYVEQKRAWRDKIALEKVRRRAKNLEMPNLGRLSEPKGVGETTFQTVFNDATGAVKSGDDVDAVQRWEAMAQTLRADDPNERPWHFLALERAEQVKAAMAERHAAVSKLLDTADRLMQDGKVDEARKLRQDVKRRFGPVKHLAALIADRVDRYEAAHGSSAPPADEAPPAEPEKPQP